MSSGATGAGKKAVSKRGLTMRLRASQRAIEKAALGVANAQSSINALKSNLSISNTNAPAGRTAKSTKESVEQREDCPEGYVRAASGKCSAVNPVGTMEGGRRRRRTRSARKGKKSRKGSRKN